MYEVTIVMTDEITVKNTTPGKRYLGGLSSEDDTLVKPGEEKTLEGEDVERAEVYIEKGDFEVVEGDVDVEEDSQDEKTKGSASEAKKGFDAEPVIDGLPHLSDEQKNQLKQDYDNLGELHEDLTQDKLEDMEDIGPAYAEDIRETIEEQ